MNINIYKEKIESWMENYFKTKDVGDSSMLEPIIYSLKVGGKRIRPILMICTYNMYNNSIDEILPFAAPIH